MHILTVSNTSKQELVNELNISEEKISVVYNAVSSIFKDQLDIWQVKLNYLKKLDLPYNFYVEL